MHRFVVLLVAILAVVIAQENSSDQERVSSLEERIRELEAIIELKDRSAVKRTSPDFLLGNDLTKPEACTCHYCEDEFIRPESCTDCEGYCDPCDFCTGAATSIMNAATCTAYNCPNAGYTIPPAVTPNTAEQCQDVYTASKIVSDAKPLAHWRWNGFDYLRTTAPTNPLRISRVWLSFMLTNAATPTVTITGTLWKAASKTAQSPQGATAIQNFGSITIDSTSKKWYSFEPSSGTPVQLDIDSRYFFAFGAYKVGTPAVTFNMWTFPDSASAKNPISLPAGYDLIVHNFRGFTGPNENTIPANWKGDVTAINYAIGASASTIMANQNYQWYPEFITTPVA